MFNKYAKYIYAIIIFYVVWIVGIPLGFRFLTTPVLSVLKNNFGINIVVEKPRLITGILPNIKLYADDIKLLNQSNETDFEIVKPKLKLRILPLLSGRVHINSFECDNCSINAVLKEKLYIAGFPLELKQQQLRPPKINRIKVKKMRFNLDEISPSNNYLVNVENFYFKNTRTTFITHGKTKCTFNGQTMSSRFDISLPHRKNLKRTKFDIDIDDFNFAPFSDIVTRCVYDEVTELSGIVDLHTNTKKMSADFSNVKILFKDGSKNIILPNNMKVQSNYKIGEDSFRIKKLIAQSDRLKAELSGNIKNIFSKNPYLDIKVNLDKSDIREGAMMLPPIVTPDISIPKLKEYPFYGNIFGQLRIRGKLPEPDITGNVKVTDGVLIRPIPNATSGANINIDFTGKKLVIDVVVPAGGREVVYVSGDVELYGEKFAHLKVKSSQTVKLELAEFVLNPLHEILCFMIGPLPIMEVTGVGNVDIRIVGTKKDPHIWGDFNFKNANASFIDVKHLVLANADGNLNFNNQSAHFINNTGTLHGKPATVDGTCTLFGNLNFDVKADGQNLEDLYTILTTSPMLEEMHSLIPNLTDIKGTSDFYLHLKGKLYDINDLKLNENVLPSGYIKLNNNSVKAEGIPINGISGVINYDKKDCDLDLKALISSASTSVIKGVIKDNKADVTLSSPKINVNELEPNKLKNLDRFLIKLDAHYKGEIKNIDIKGIDAVVEVLKDNKPIRAGKILSGKITLKNSNLSVSNLNGVIKRNPFNMNLTVSNLNKELKNSVVNGVFNCKELDLTALNFLIKSKLLPTDLQKICNNVEFKHGLANLNIKSRHNQLNGVISVNNAELELAPVNLKDQKKIPFFIKKGQILINNNNLNINQFHCSLDEMPVIIYGKVGKFLSNPHLNLRINSKLAQKTFDKYWNFNNIYPIKVKGDIISSVGIDGTKDNLRVRTDVKLEPNSSIYYMGATLGDNINSATVNVDMNIDKSEWIKLNKLNYNKLISSQNKKDSILPLFKISGQLKPSGKICYLKNLTVKTENPTNADLFNIIFKKPTIKSGSFTSDMVINGTSLRPKIIGSFLAKNVDMPYINTLVKDFDIKFKPDNIQATTKGTVLNNYIMINSNMKNNLTPPYRITSADIYINDLDLDNTLNEIKQVELKGISSAISLDTDLISPKILNSLIMSNIKLRTGNVRTKNIKASNLEAVCGLNEKMIFSVDGLKFNMAGGTITGKLKYNLSNNFMQTELNSKGVNANELVIALFELPNQIYGSLTGHIELDCNATDDKTRLTTLNGFGTFSVSKGRMPKLGSLEYLLKAGSLVKGGITGLTMNSVIDILKPMRTGEFSSIDGRIRIKDGVAKTIEIRTIGKGLSLYVIGSLNLYSQIADMHVYGQLSKRVSTVLGAAGNISLNTLFTKIPWVTLDSNSPIINDLNKIPGIELSSKSYRRFMVEILGDIGGDSFVKSFKWIN